MVTMKIYETYADFIGEVSVGRFAYILKLSGCNLECDWCDTPEAREKGIEIPVDDIVVQAKHFKCVLVTGGEPLMQKKEVGKFLTKLKKVNPSIDIIIETNGTIIPIGMPDYNTTTFNVDIKLKNTKNEFGCRIVPKAIAWFVNMNANFKFVVLNQDDLDEVQMFANDHGIKKNKIYIISAGDTVDEQWKTMRKVAGYAKQKGYNFSPRLGILLNEK